MSSPRYSKLKISFSLNSVAEVIGGSHAVTQASFTGARRRRVDELPQEAGRAADVADTLALAVAALARARAIRLRRQAEAAEVKESDVVEPADAEEADVATELDEAEVTDSEVAATGVESMTDDTAVSICRRHLPHHQ